MWGAFTDGLVVIREQKNVIFFIRMDSFVALQSFSFLKADASEDREEDNEIEGVVVVVVERAFTRTLRYRMEEQLKTEAE